MVHMRRAQDARLDELATRRDLKELELILQREIALNVATAKVELVRWVVTMGLVILGGVVTAIRFIPPSQPLYYHAPMEMPAAPATVPGRGPG